MKKHNLIVFLPLFLLLSLLACQHDPVETLPLPREWKGPQTFGSVTAQRNGEFWVGSGGWTYAIDDSTYIGISMGTTDMDTILIEALTLNNLPLKVGKYELEFFLNSPNYRPKSSTYVIGYDDQFDVIYFVNEAMESYAILEEIDLEKKLISGSFHLNLCRFEGDSRYPMWVEFSDGRFEAYLIE